MNRNAVETFQADETLSVRVVRRIAARHGLTLVKGRGQISIDNLGEYMLLDEHKTIIGGPRFDMTETEILDYINELRLTV